MSRIALGKKSKPLSETFSDKNKEIKKDELVKHYAKTTQAIGILALSFMLVGCAEIGIFGSKNQSFSGTDSIVLDQPKVDILDVIADVGKSMKFDVSAIDKNAGQITLSAGASFGTTMLIGKMQQSSLTVTIADGGKKLGITVFVMGNFGTGDQEAADKLVADFKARLAERLRTE